MKQIAIFLSITLVITLSSCSNQMTEYLNMGNEAYETNNYELALSNWDKIIRHNENKHKKTSADLFLNAGLAALKTDDQLKAKSYLSQAYDKGLTSPELLLGLADIYKEINNLSYELSYLEQLVSENTESPAINDYRIALFDAYVRSENWEKASLLWPELNSSSQEDIKLLSDLLDVQKALKNTDACFVVSEKILKQDPDHFLAQEIQAMHYFNKAESLYQQEMSVYNAKKTRSQYAKLLKSLKIATADFKVSRDYFENLYKISEQKKHAQFLSNIYARLNNKQKSNYYKKLSN